MASFDIILFDVDGTLVDATTDIANAMNHALRVLALPELPKEAIVSHIGSGVKDLIRKSLGTDDEAIIERGTKLYGDHYIAHAADETVLYPHAVDILESLKDRRKFILTNRYASFADAALRGLGIRNYFEAIIGGDDENCIKPSACVMKRAVKQFGIVRSKSLIVADMDKAIEYYQSTLSGIDKKLLNHLNDAYHILHLEGYYGGIKNIKIINDGFEIATLVINALKPYSNNGVE